MNTKLEERQTSLFLKRSDRVGATRRRPRRWIPLLLTLILVVPTVISYGGALSAPGTDSFGIRSTEWLRSHHFRWLVNDVENFYYSHHQPKKGGAPTGLLAQQIAGADHVVKPSGSLSQLSVGPLRLPLSTNLPPPSPIAPIASDPIAGEGQWQPLGQPVNGHPAMYATYLRPDAVHTSLVTAVAWIDTKTVKAVGYAGVQEPGGGPWTNEVPIPDAVRPQLLAAFNSGFKMQDAQGGYYADGRYARPLRDGAATVWIDTNGVLNVGQWGRDVQMTGAIAFARQNLSLIVDHSQPVPDVATGDSAKWGQTVNRNVLVWRSGLGVTADGAAVYVGGPGLSALTLAQVLTRAGAVRAMELDINSAWVDYFTYGPAAPGHAPSDLTVTKLLANMVPSTSNYLAANSRDSITLFRRS
ncbi:MAG: phosphodiester glycosidase family protein [Actinomycetota bacterium]|nr:phosphodiester glycosidase family protein [Actinomycetota bacterium]